VLGYARVVDGFGLLLKRWRKARGLSQEELAHRARVSTRHLSCLETGRASPSRPMVLSLAETLELPFRERNNLLSAAGFAPRFGGSGLDDPNLAHVRRALDHLLSQQEPFGAVVMDRLYNVISMNRGALRLLRLIPSPPPPPLGTNLYHLLLHPDGLRPLLLNFDEITGLLLSRLEREVMVNDDQPLGELLQALRAYGPVPQPPEVHAAGLQPFGVLRVKRPGGELALFTMLTSLGTPLDVTAEELRIESYFPADEASERWLRAEAEAEAEAQTG
jgi:transcriptional regulator with XRE-family HTH domain